MNLISYYVYAPIHVFFSNIFCFVLKESFAKAFVKHYSRVSIVLMEAKDRVMVANRFVHISVQLFSNESLAVFLTEHHNLLLTIILSLANMMQSIQVASLLEGQWQEVFLFLSLAGYNNIKNTAALFTNCISTKVYTMLILQFLIF